MEAHAPPPRPALRPRREHVGGFGHVAVDTIEQVRGTVREALRGRRAWVVAGAVAVLLLAYVGVAWALSGRVPSGVAVDGVPIGGQSRDSAVQTLDDDLTARAAEPVQVTVGDATDALDPTASGLTLDIDGTVDDLVGFSVDPRAVWRHVAGSSEVSARTVVDDDVLAAAVAELATRVDGEKVEGAVTFADGAAVAAPARQGRVLDVEGAVEALSEQWWTGRRPVDLPAELTEPAIDQEDVDAAMVSFATPATAGPLLVAVGEQQAELAPALVTPALRLDPVDGTLVPVVDGEVLKAAVLAANASIAAEAEDAGFTIEGGRPVVVPAATGVTIDAAALATAALEALATPERTVTVDSAVAEPDLTTAEAEALGVVEVVSEFSTNLTANAERTENLDIAARTVNGTLLLPGETFSLNDTLGRRTPEKGYNEAPVIVRGRLTEQYGGGVSQMATTLFNGMFFAGLEDVEHRPHSFYISRYPEGREATVNFGTIDLRFTNDTQHGVFIETWLAGGQVNTRFWSTEVWDIRAEKGPRRNVTQPETVRDSDEECISQSAQVGFDVTVTRFFYSGGDLKRTEEFNTRYKPETEVICT